MKKIIDDIRLIYKCCSLYYEDNMNQQEISNILQISRPSVARMIKSGKTTGIVKIQITNPKNLAFADIEREIEKKFNLLEVIVAESINKEKDTIKSINCNLSKEFLKFISRIAEDEEYIGVTMGMTLRNLICGIKEIDNSDLKSNIEKLRCKFVPIVGGIGESRNDIHSNYIAMTMAEIFNTNCLQFFAPLVFSRQELLEKFLKEKSMESILKAFNKISTIVMGIGILDSDYSTILKAGYIDRKTFDSFVKNGAVGDIAMQFFDKDGDTKRYDNFNKLISGMSIDQLKKVRRRIGIATGNMRAKSVIGAIKGGFVNILVIDYECAKELLAYEE